MKHILLAALIILAACSTDDPAAPNSNNPPRIQHDTLEALTPPAVGGALPGYWHRNGAPEGRYEITPQGYRGVYGALYTTDLRVDGMRVWFDAHESAGGYREVFNGTASGWSVGDSIPGWALRYIGSERDGWTYRGANPSVFVRTQ